MTFENLFIRSKFRNLLKEWGIHMEVSKEIINKESNKEEKPKVGAGRMLLWQSRPISLAANVLVYGFLMIFCTDILNMPAALVGTLLMVSKIFDGFTDVFAGYLVDRTNTKIGRARPYELAIIGLWICTWLLFATSPEWSLVVKSIWIVVMYFFVHSIFATFLNVSNTVYLVRAFLNREHHVAISTYGSIIVLLGAVVVNVTFPILMGSLGTTAGGWKILMAIFAIPGILIGLLRFFTIKETHDVDAVTEASDGRINIKDVITVLKTNQFIYMLALMILVFNFVTNMGVQVFYFTHIVKNVALMGPLALIQVIAFPVLFLFPRLIKKYSTVRIIIAGFVVSASGYFINFLAYDNYPLLIIGNIFTGVGTVPVSMMLPLLIIDNADYNEWQGRQRLEGTLGSVTNVTSKIGAAVGTGGLGLLLGLVGYAGELDAQPDSALFMIRMLYTLIPMALYLLTALMMSFYKLDGLIPQIREDLDKRRKEFQMDEETV